MLNFPKKYDHNLENEINKVWKENDLFLSKNNKNIDFSNWKKFSISMPPPNVTWILHNGHAFMLSIQDAIIRHARMLGYDVLYIPWTDHAWIATQSVVEKSLKKKWITKYDLWREKFVEEVWTWSKKSRNKIISQINSMWVSVDRSKEQFTFSERLSRAVRKAFVELEKKWKIYKWDRIVNWCSKSKSVISDIEVNYKTEEVNMYYIRYFIEWKWDSITVATVRPETIFADVAIAVNPKDKRYKKYIWKNVLIPIVNRTIPVIADEYVDTVFGTGALKITPTHDINDFEIGKRHNLPMDRFSIDKNWKFTDLAWEFAGYDWEDVYSNFLQTLEEIWNIEMIERYETQIPYSERYNNKIQPILSKQWFVDVDEMAQKSIKTIKDWETKIYPQRFDKIYYEWLENIKHWCISRQIWWGHRIPVWYCKNWHKNSFDEDNVLINDDKKKILSMIIFNLIADTKLKNPFNIEDLINILFEDSIVPREWKIYETYLNIYQEKFKNDNKKLEQVNELLNLFNSFDLDSSDLMQIWEDLIEILDNSSNITGNSEFYKFNFVCKSCNDENLKQDEDVLDTWFSSSLWPFSILGWPENTQDLKDYYPNTVMETWYDIIFFRVARMMMMWNEIMGKKAFDNIYLHWLVRDYKWQKISKSLWNNIDPLEIVEKYWADSLRLSLILWTTPWNDMKFSMDKLDYNKRFINKLWNASRFIYMNALAWDKNISINYNLIRDDIKDNIDKLNDFDKWILWKLNNLSKLWNNYLDKFMLWEFGQEIIKVAWHDFCDWYIEISKVQESEYTSKILIYGIWTILKFLHPYIPFVSEKLWSLLWFEWYLINSQFPQIINFSDWDPKIKIFMDIVWEYRNLRSETDTKPHEKVDIILSTDTVLINFIKKYEKILISLVWTQKINYSNSSKEITDDYSVWYVDDTKLWLRWIKKLSNKDILKNLEKELEDENQFLQWLRNLVSSPWFIEKAPANVVEDKTNKIKEIKKKIENIEYEIAKLKIKN